MSDTPIALIDVLVCTYRRPALLLKTLDGIARAAATLGPVRIVVVDNDHGQSARAPVAGWRAPATVHVDVAVSYFSQPVQNISLTRNLAFDHATAPWIAMIDDDEVPDPGWLAALLATAEGHGADVVFGPVIAEFDPGAPLWAKHGPVFQRRRFSTGTAVPLREARSGNVLLRASRLTPDGVRFEPVLGLSGGEDSEFFLRLHQRGYRMVWCDEACVREWTPPSRTNVPWLLTRTFRIGSVDAFNRRRQRRFGGVMVGLLKHSVFVVQGTLLAAVCAPFARTRCVHGLCRAALGAGYWYGLLVGPYQEYRQAAAPAGRPS